MKNKSEAGIFKFVSLKLYDLRKNNVENYNEEQKTKKKTIENPQKSVAIDKYKDSRLLKTIKNNFTSDLTVNEKPFCLVDNKNDDIEPCPPWGRNGASFSTGVGELMVVKRHVLRYEASEVAHIENIMPYEERDKIHRFLERQEEIYTFEKSYSSDIEKALEQTEKYSISKEAEQTINEDQKYGFDLSVSGKYGSTQFESNFNYSNSITREETNKKTTNYARNVVDRTVERIKQRVREERVVKILRETEETSSRKIKNENDSNVVGVYQFVDKIYRAQVFNYGLRQMFDVYVPEPSSFIWNLKDKDNENVHQADPQPEPLDISPLQIAPHEEYMSLPGRYVHYDTLVKKYNVRGVIPPKEFYTTFSVSKEYPSVSGDEPAVGGANDAGSPRFVDAIEMIVPEGYSPVKAVVTAIAISDAPRDINIRFSIDGNSGIWVGGEFAVESRHQYIRQGSIEIDLNGLNAYAGENESKLHGTLLLYDTSTWTVNIKIKCKLTERSIREWQLETYDKVQSAYLDLLDAWKEKNREEQSSANKASSIDKDYGLPPAIKKNIIITELKKHCISILTGYWYEHNNLMIDGVDGSAPSFDLDKTDIYGKIVQFLEQAFEWNQIQYAFYPYYWSEKKLWKKKFMVSDPNYEFQQFQQAGAARVVFPVRTGFEKAVNYYIENQKLPENDSELRNEAFLSIVDQIKEQSGESLEEPRKIGEPWEIRVPTSLMILNKNGELPKWKQINDIDWEWVVDE